MKIHKKIKIKWIVVATLILLIALPLTANAAGETVSGQLSDVFGEVLNSFAQFLTIMLKVLQRILWPIFLAIGGLLNNDILFGYGMEQRLLQVWVQVRNIVNVIFVLALLGVALFNVLAFKPESEFSIGKFLPKFAIALIAVNFSYIGMKIILDVSNVMTYAVFALPSSISNQVATPDFLTCNDKGQDCSVNDNDKSKETVKKICTAYYGTTADLDKIKGEILKNYPENQVKEVTDSLLCKAEGSNYTLSPAGFKFFGRFNSRNVALIMAVQFMNVTSVDTVTSKYNIGAGDIEKIDLSGMALNLLFAVVLYIVYGAAYIAIFVVLLTRLVVLWLFIALSPVFVLKYVLPDSFTGGMGGDLGDKFFKNTFAPVLMGVPLTIGYIILEAFKGMGYSQEGTTSDLAIKLVRVDNAALSDLQSMIIAFAAVAVVWVGVFTVADSTFAAGFVQKIKGTVAGIGAKAAKAITFIPAIPAGQGGKGYSLAQARDVWSEPWRKLEQKYGSGSRKKDVSVAEINKLATNRKAKVEEAKTAIAGGLGTAQGQKAVAQMLERWKTRGSTEQKPFARRAIQEIENRGLYKDLKAGKLTPGQRAKLQGIPYLKPSATTPTPTRSKQGAKQKASAKQASQRVQDMQNISDASSLGVVSADLLQKRDKYMSADMTGKAKIGDDISKNHGDEMKRIRTAVANKAHLDPVAETAGKITDASKADPKVIKKLGDDLEKAEKALAGKKVKPEETKKILGDILKNKIKGDITQIKDDRVKKYL